MSETPTTPAPELLSAERLAEICELHEAWLPYRAKCLSAAIGAAERFVETLRGQRGDLLDHAAAQAEQIRLLTMQLTPGSTTERYPTVWAYEQACMALEAHRSRADKAEEAEHLLGVALEESEDRALAAEVQVAQLKTELALIKDYTALAKHAVLTLQKLIGLAQC